MFIVYVTIAFGVPVMLMFALSPSHIVVVPLMLAVGNGNTVTTTLSVRVCKQLGVLASSTLTNV